MLTFASRGQWANMKTKWQTVLPQTLSQVAQDHTWCTEPSNDPTYSSLSSGLPSWYLYLELFYSACTHLHHSSSAPAFWDGTALGICWRAVRPGLGNQARKVTSDHDQLRLSPGPFAIVLWHWSRTSAAALNQPLTGNDSENAALDVHVRDSLITTSEKQIPAGKATSKTPFNLFS